MNVIFWHSYSMQIFIRDLNRVSCILTREQTHAIVFKDQFIEAHIKVEYLTKIFTGRNGIT